MSSSLNRIAEVIKDAAGSVRWGDLAEPVHPSYSHPNKRAKTGSSGVANKNGGKNTPEAARRELIRQITQNQRVAVGKLAEAQSYAPTRALITDPKLGLGVPVDNVVVDAPVPFGRERPDIQIWLEGVPVSLRNESEHLYAIIELKSGTKVKDSGKAVAKGELESYSYRKLRHLYLADAEVIQRYDLQGNGIPEPRQLDWIALEDENTFLDFFAPLGETRRSLRTQLREFASVEIPPGATIVTDLDRRRFVDAIVTTARLLSSAVSDLVDRQLVPDLKGATIAIEALVADYGALEIDFRSEDPILFANEPDGSDRAAHAVFNERYTALMAAIEDQLYALRAEHEDLPAYAERSGLKRENASFLKTTASGEAKATAISAKTSYIQETATLLFSRLLMVRFSEDYGLLPRIISNGGLSKFASFAEQVDDRFQALVQTAYRRARPIYRHLFEAKPLDWLLDGDDQSLSDTLLHVMWILAGWDFTTVRGDILSGIYDRNLDAAQRRALGEVYTRPELASYLLSACGYDGSQSVLDPACGSGTFLVEGFEIVRRRKQAAGVDFGHDDIIETLRRLHGMDVNGFSATLAQIQLVWHALSVAGEDKVALMKDAITVIEVEGGHSSLETWGLSMNANDLFAGTAGNVSVESRAANRASRRHLRNADRRFRDLSSRKEGFQIIAGNPPYVRVHRLRLTPSQEAEYRELRRKQTDLSVLFTYRAMEWWLAPGGRLGFYLPLALSESAYAEPLRAILAKYKIVEIIDLEEIGNVAFHGANVVTMGLVIEKSPAAPDDMVKITRVTTDCYQQDLKRIDMSRAISDLVPASAIELARYLPGTISLSPITTIEDQATLDAHPDDAGTDAVVVIDAADDAGDEEADDDGAGASDTAWLTKVRSDDVPILDKLSGARRLDDLILRGWKRIGKGKSLFAASVPAGEAAYRWKQVRVMGYGVKVGGQLPDITGGKPIYKAKNLPPDGFLAAEAAGSWDGDPAAVDTVRFYAWKDVGEQSNTFAIRNIATQPVFAPHPADAYLTNTVYCMRLSEWFPLNVWSVSRIVAWYMALTARTSVVQGFFTTFYPRQTTRMPVPSVITTELNGRLSAIGDRIFAADGELARGDQDLDAVRQGHGSKPLRNRLDLIEQKLVSSPKDVTWPSSTADWAGVRAQVENGSVVFVATDEDGQQTPAPTLTGTPCRIEVADADLRTWVLSEARIRLADERLPDRAWLTNLSVPDDPTAAVELLRRFEDASALTDLMRAIDDLDEIVAEALGLNEAERSHIRSAFENDDMLGHVRPQWRHRVRRLETV